MPQTIGDNLAELCKCHHAMYHANNEEHRVHAWIAFSFASRNAHLSFRTKEKDEEMGISSTFSPCIAPEAAYIDAEGAGENSMSTTNIVLILSSVMKQFDTEGENNQNLDFTDFYNTALREYFSPLLTTEKKEEWLLIVLH